MTTTEATPTQIDTPQPEETPTSNNGQQPDNFLKQILNASGMDLSEIAITYGALTEPQDIFAIAPSSDDR